MIYKSIDILCVGLMVCDIVAKPVGKSVFDVDSSRIDALKVVPGGDALNAAINMSKLGLGVALVGKVGMDMMGDFLCGEASRAGVDTSTIIKCIDMSTSTSIVLIDEDGERRFIYYGKANDALQLEDVSDDVLSSARIVHLGSAMALAGLDGDGLQQLFKKAKSAGAVTSMDVTWDSMGHWLANIEGALRYTDIFMPSLQEAQIISGKSAPEDVATFFQGYGVKTMVVKLGDKGCYITDFDKSYALPAFDIGPPADTTGAGDAFVSGFLAGVIRGKGLYGCGELGNAVAASCVMELGATTGVKNWDETMRFIESFKK